MGLDKYSYSRSPDAEDCSENNEELTYWRKHNRLHGWMEQLWEDKGRPNFTDADSQAMGDFNCVELELTESDLEQLEAHVNNKALPETGGFFFGDDSFSWDNDNDEPFAEGDYYHKKNDLEFINLAYKAIREGKKVYYNSWW